MDEIESTAPPENAPAARGARIEWLALPVDLRATIEQQFGAAVAEARSQSGGFSPGVAARLRLADGRRAFIKAVSAAQNPDSPDIHRREIRVAGALPADAPVARLLWSLDQGGDGWVVLAFDDIDGRQPLQPWQTEQLALVLDAMRSLHQALTPSPLTAGLVPSASELFATNMHGWRRLRDEQPGLLVDPWSLRHLDALVALELEAPQAAAGNTLLHFDLRADNMLLNDHGVWFIDWPHAAIGAAWLDLVLLVPSATMHGNLRGEALLEAYLAGEQVDARAINAAISGFAGFLMEHSLRPAPPGLPTLRAFQAAQARAACEWLAERTNWR